MRLGGQMCLHQALHILIFGHMGYSNLCTCLTVPLWSAIWKPASVVGEKISSRAFAYETDFSSHRFLLCPNSFIYKGSISIRYTVKWVLKCLPYRIQTICKECPPEVNTKVVHFILLKRCLVGLSMKLSASFVYDMWKIGQVVFV